MEGEDIRVLRAGIFFAERELAEISVIGSGEKIKNLAREEKLNLAGIHVIDESQNSPLDDYQDLVNSLSQKQQNFISHERGAGNLDLILGCLKLLNNEVDGVVCGAVYPTKTTLKAGFKLIGLAEGNAFVSSFFIMLMDEQVLIFSDCAVNISPSSEQLAEIARQCVVSARELKMPAKIAFLSYSTGDSGAGEEVNKVKKANELFQQKNATPSEGPIQFDAAIDFATAEQKIPNSPLKGDANVFIFPDLNSGNITYKAVQRLGGGWAVGPILQGLKKPFNDLSRGASVEDIILTILITALKS